MTENKSIGIVGLGLLGSALAERFLKSGFSVIGFDLSSDRLGELEQSGGHAVSDVTEIASCSRILFSLPNSNISSSVIDQLLSRLQPGTIILDTTTGDPQQMTELGNRLSEVRVSYLDATVGGSSRQARDGDVIVMVGGAADAFEECRILLECFSHQIFHVGPCGSGALMKLVMNLILGLNRAVLAEGLSLARGFGLELTEVLNILKNSPAFSRVMETKGDKMIQQEFSPQARLSQHLKDVRLILENGIRCEAKLPLSELHAQLLEMLEANGWGEDDNSAIIKAFD